MGQHSPGWVNAGDRILKRLLRSGQAKSDLKTIFSQIDPDSTPGLVRTALWTDTELALSALGTLPRLANVFIEGLAELSHQGKKLPAALLGAALFDSLSSLRLKKLGRAGGRLASLAIKIGAQSHDWNSLSAGFVQGLTQELSPSDLRQGVERALSAHPELVEEVLKPLLEPILESLSSNQPQGVSHE